MKIVITDVLKKTEGVLHALAGVALVLMMLVVVYDIAGRSFGWWFVLSTVEQTTLYIMISGFLGLASCFRDEGNIIVDLATQKLSTMTVRHIDAFWAIVAALVLLLLSIAALRDGFTLHGYGQRSEVLRISPLVHHAIASLGFVIAALVSIVECLKLAGFKQD